MNVFASDLCRMLPALAAGVLISACAPAPESAPPAAPSERPAPTAEQLEREQQELARRERVAQAARARFELLDNGVALDQEAGLMWARCALGMEWTGQTCAGKARQLNWDQALEEAERASLAGHDDWRLPTQPELYALTYCSTGVRSEPNREGLGGGCAGDYASPTIVEEVFPATPIGNFWTSTPHARFNFSAWGVSFNTGHTGTGGRNDYVFVRLVRDVAAPQ
ncbi:MAG: DUF1566 domain-containing protein [Rhodocyclaceae bacterium]|nr:DUF1566 domain-containing protein [Rhodocyclaceae bacterium]